MNKRSARTCPICQEIACQILRTLKFVLPEGHPLSNGYDVVVCDRCGFVYADTAANQQDYDAFYARYSKYEDNQTSTGGGESSWDAQRLQETAAYIASCLPDRNARILDVGCANGGLLRAIKEQGYSNLCGLDPSPVCAANTQKLHGIEAIAGSLTSVPAMLGQFDCVILSHVMEHLPNLRTAVQQIRQLTRAGGWVYVEVPDASRYAEFVTSPFQDFNTEHINHFSIQCLDNLFCPAGWAVRSHGNKIIYSSPNMPYPAILGTYTQTAVSAQPPAIKRDATLQEKIQAYILRSQTIMDNMEITLQDVLRQSPQVIVWGTGQLALKLLAETSLGQAHIAAFVDGNPVNQGQVLRGVPILAPEQAKNLEYPIIVTSILHQQAIADVIKNRLGLLNRIVFL